MGLILDVPGQVHAEARRESFVLYDDFGASFSVELEWRLLPHLHRALRALDEHARRMGISDALEPEPERSSRKAGVTE